MAVVDVTPEIEALARQLAEATGTTPEQAVLTALRLQIASTASRHPPETSEQREARMRRIDALLKQIHASRIDYSQSEDEILGYDEFGVPEQPYLGR